MEETDALRDVDVDNKMERPTQDYIKNHRHMAESVSNSYKDVW
jgi:hypothetical protein